MQSEEDKSTNKKKRPLEGIKVIELAQYISGPYCGLLLAGLGAEVVKIEQPGTGDISRKCGPFPDDLPHPNRSGLFHYLNRNKRGITLNIETATGREILLGLLREATVIIEDLPPKSSDRLEIDYNHLSKLNPRLIVTSITPFGLTGPYRDYKAYPINASAIGGMSSIIGDPKREPITPPFSLGCFQTGIIATNAIMFALLSQRKTGKGQQIDISEAESWAIFHTGNAVSSFIYMGRKRNRTGHRTPGPYPYTILPCNDGYVSMIALRGAEWKRFLEIMGEGEVPEWYASDPRFQDRLKAGMEHADLLDDLLSAWLMSHTKEEIFRLCRKNHIPFAPVRNMAEVVESEQFREREYFAEIKYEEGARFKSPGPPVRFSRGLWDFKRPAPSLSEHNEEVYAKGLGYTNKQLSHFRRMDII
jgi:CoA:oxalate CoA-transferase